MIRINWHLFGNHSGYSQAAQDMVLALDQDGRFDVRVDYIGGKQPTRPAISDSRYICFKKLSQKDPENRVDVFHCIPTLVPQIRKELTGKNIGFATFETFSPPKQWIKLLNRNDAIIAPSKFNYKIFAHEGIKRPLFHIPHCIDMDAFTPQITPMEKRDKFTFLFFGAWRKRKGYESLVEAWLRGFSRQKDIQLLIKTDLPNKAYDYIHSVANNIGIRKEEIGPLLFEKKVFSEQELPSFLKSVHCLISPTMGEGFGLPGLQCMALGIPIITTNFSGCQDYALPHTATLLEPNCFVLDNCMDGIPQFGQKKWALVSVKNVMESMQNTVNEYDQKILKANVGRKYIESRFSYETVSGTFHDMIGSVYDG